ncbi:MAG: hypothetical protein M2R45_03637 [Verrucomicrobia subdivision 3 bacterium]|nr:hypothetical protein [Limisphaerales bacterium]MCS1416867.1 hypothetical protein [Limisphaerales bacterium]
MPQLIPLKHLVTLSRRFKRTFLADDFPSHRHFGNELFHHNILEPKPPSLIKMNGTRMGEQCLSHLVHLTAHGSNGRVGKDEALAARLHPLAV